ncbi:MAG: four helix bundle protein [Planctomycetota bacterium]|nr:four helix bundle protein [Planctomycetota bacterium]MDI6787899.1 four helix bundle protein [Planctomycetota bacterium]
MGDAPVRDIKERTFEFALRVIKLVKLIPRDETGRILIRQVIRSATSIGANIEEAHAGLSRKDFTHSMNIAKKEAYETRYWIRLIAESGLMAQNKLTDLLQENNEIISILTSTVKTLQQGKSDNL